MSKFHKSIKIFFISKNLTTSRPIINLSRMTSSFMNIDTKCTFFYSLWIKIINSIFIIISINFYWFILNNSFILTFMITKFPSRTILTRNKYSTTFITYRFSHTSNTGVSSSSKYISRFDTIHINIFYYNNIIKFISNIIASISNTNNVKIILTFIKIGISFIDEYFAEISFTCFIK